MFLRFHILIFLLALQRINAQPIVYNNVIGLGGENKITESNIRKITQDKFGYMWIATQENIIKYDGNNIERFSSSEILSKYKISGVDVRAFAEDTLNNEMNVMSTNGAVDVFNTTTNSIIKRHNPIPGQEDNFFTDFVITPNHIWFNSFKGVFVYNKNDKTIKPLLSKNTSSNKSLFYSLKLFKDDNGNIWVFNDKTSIRIYNDNLVQQNADAVTLGNEGFINNLVITDVLSIKKNNVLLASGKGIIGCKYNSQYQLQIQQNPIPFFTNKPVYALCRADNNLYIASNSFYVLSDFTNQLTEFKDRNSTALNNWLGSVQNLYASNNNLLWLGTKNGIAYLKNSPNPFVSYYKNENNSMGLEHVNYVLPAYNNQKYVCTDAGLFKVSSTNNFKLITNQDAYVHMMQTGTNTYIVSGKKGLAFLKNDNLFDIGKVYKEFIPFKNIFLNASLFYPDSVVVFGTDSFDGIFIWDRKKHSLQNIKAATKSFNFNTVNQLIKINDSSLYILSDRAIFYYNLFTKAITKHIITHQKNGDALGIIFDMELKKTTNILAIYGEGIVVTDKNFNIIKIYNNQNGLSNNGVYKLFGISDSTVLATTNFGLNLINLHTHFVYNYNTSDGLHGNTFEESCGYQVDSMIYAGGVKGFTQINTQLLKNSNTLPTIFFSKIITDYPNSTTDTINLNANKYVIKSDALQTTIHFSCINWANPQKVKYTYRIVEESPKWIPLANENFIKLIGIAPGNYHLQVKAQNEAGWWSKTMELTIKVQPKWYQTKIFFALLLFITLLLLYSLYRYRISQFKKQQLIRKNIAADLHDDLGSTLNAVKVFTNLAIGQQAPNDNLVKAKENLTEASISLRDIIWVLDDKLDTVGDLANKINQYAKPITLALGIMLQMDISTQLLDKKITKQEKRNFFLIIKEALNNALKYAEATIVFIAIKPSNKKIEIVIKDNGKGFDLSSIKKGNGLNNMQQRGLQIKYLLSIHSTPNQGSTIVIKPN